MKPIVVHKFRIRRLWDLCDDGIFAVPEIQREFVWDPRRASNLLDSIYRQLPIGTLLIWESTSDRRHLLRHTQRVLPPHSPANRRIWFLIDGQQRLSVLYRARHGHEVVNDNGRTLDFSRLCFSFDDRHEGRFIFVRRPLPRLHIPVVDILSANWRRRLRHLPAGKMKEVEACRARISSYEVPVVFVHTSELEEIRETFLRINSGGLRISKADRAFSKAARLDLRRLITELRRSLTGGFDACDPRTIQAAMSVILGQREISSKAIETVVNRLEREEMEAGRVSRKFTREWKEISDCVQKAVDYLIKEFSLPNFTFLPSENMLVVLAFFFHANNRAQPNSLQRREIRRWFWATAVSRRYVGRGYYRNIRQDLAFFERLGGRRDGHFRVPDLLPTSEVQHTDYLVEGSLAKAFLLLLIRRGPCYLESGSAMPLDKTASAANRNDKHHIFPRALLARQGFAPRDANSICNICYLVAEENQSIGSNRPATYLAGYRRLKHFARVMRSHLIPYRADSGLWLPNVRRGYRQFVAARLHEICTAFEREAGVRLFRRD